MEIIQFKNIAHLEGLDFIKALLKLEEDRFTEPQFLKGSTFENINTDFGIFPTMAAYPVYFAGDITKPEDKIIFMGINPGFNEKGDDNKKEQAFLKEHGSFDGYCRLFNHFKDRKKGLLRYYASIASFISQYFDVPIDIIKNWDWFQEHFITLNLIPYHSANAKGLRINNYKKFREVYFEVLLKLLKHLDPQKPIFINGFPTYKSFLDSKEFEGVTEHDNFCKGKIGGYDFIGLPFLNRPTGGKEKLVENIKKLL